MRYRSRRDLGEMLLDTVGTEHHRFKLAALEKTVAFPATGNLNVLIVGLVVALIGCVIYILIS
jgi:hypothetical protein